MEKPYKGRATIQDNLTDLQIIIPAKRNWLAALFLGGWLGGWLMGELFALGALLSVLRGNPANLFVLFWLVAWTAFGIFAIRTLVWLLAGKEIITVGGNKLEIKRKAALFSKPKVFDLDAVKNIRAQEIVSDYERRRLDFGGLSSAGTIRFDYGLKTVQFASGIDEAEARFILEKLKERRLLTEKNFS